MVQLIINYSTNKITGYNTVIPNNTKDLVIVSKEELNKFKNRNNLYYENGVIVEKEIDEDYQELKDIENIEREFKRAVDNEQKTFMDNILAGKSLEEAASIARVNREQLANAKKMKEQFNKKQMEKRTKNIIQKFANEELEIHMLYLTQNSG